MPEHTPLTEGEEIERSVGQAYETYIADLLTERAKSMPKPEHTPLTESELERCLAETDEYDYECHLPIRVILEDLTEARRLLRAVEWGGGTADGSESCCPECGALEHDIKPGFAAVRYHRFDCDLGRYLAASDGKGEK